MITRLAVLTLAASLLGSVGCQRGKARETATTGAAPRGTEAAAAPAQPRAADSSAVTPTPASAAPAPAAPAPAARPAAESAGGQPVLASQETNWSGTTAEVIEFRRKGNTLTARVRLRNQGSAEANPEIHYNEVYVMDAAGGKKYEVLKDETNNYIAGLRSGWADRWYQSIQPGQSQLIWMKFPAPPAEVTSVTLQIPGVQPFEDLVIQGP